ncbi:MAG: tRNA uridine-5-carboxymethylaminomethyl(34) synthesis enzyme MnmG [Sedimentisphaerales bacterium]|nr:tRNA uridine-5-carboxymethylaminomethyl(34) synthesis enzyme MnmG [Sedimentisphaerales bacterium]
MKTNDFDCIVIGAGHAGVEAAHSAAKVGAKTALITIDRNTIAQMSCNPAVGGLGKGQIAREIDALGGLMALATDATGIQFRMLNRSKGPAVQSPRAQVDRHKYADWMRAALEDLENLTIIESMASDITTKDGKVCGVTCKNGHNYQTQTVIVSPGTFLTGKLYCGSRCWVGGRINEPASSELSESLKRLGLQLGRMATDTTPRLDAGTVNFGKLQVQLGDEVPVSFSFMTEAISRPQIPCWITYTDERIHQLLRDNLHRAPLSSGQIKAADPRYCPSIEAKIVRYADKKRHRIFLEPEEEEIKTIYCNGIFTSMPRDVQDKMLKLLPGTEDARVIYYAYAVEYDFCLPIQLYPSLETRKISGLFLAGQINGTSGYEEAGGQGIMAGINAARKLQNKEPIVLGRDQGYIGVLIDDLLTKGIDAETEEGEGRFGILTEPYRMFTSRAEYRLSLRADNADRRLTQIGRSIGLVGDERWEKFQDKQKGIARFKKYLQETRSGGLSLWEQLRQPANTVMQTVTSDERVKKMSLSEQVMQTTVFDAKYEGYIAKQERLVAGLRTLESKEIPQELDYNKIEHLRAEAKEKLSIYRPVTLGQASRISGITPADITVIQIHLKSHSAD